MVRRFETEALDRYFGTGDFPLPHVSIALEEGLQWASVRNHWVWVRSKFYAQEISLGDMEKEILTQREATVANHMMFVEESRQRRYRCRRRLHPIIRRILKENH